MQDLVYELRQLARRNRDGSRATIYDRTCMLTLFGTQLVEAGYKQMRATDLKGRHVHKLVTRWQAEGISAGTFANRLSALRWWAEKVGRASVLAKHNAVYGVLPRQRVSPVSKAKVLLEDQLMQVRDPHLQLSLRLVLAFGLRRKEALLVRPVACDRGTHLALVGSMAKNGRPRDIPITTALQREVLDAAKALVQYATVSMIPTHRSYIQQRRLYDYWVARIGLGGGHGLRHRWAQERYACLSGMACPHQGGPLWDAMTEAQREADEAARLIVSQELGHNRLEIVAVYVGTNR